MNFYDALEKIMKDKKLTQSEVVARIGRSVQYISNARARGSLPKVDTASRLLGAVGYRLCAIPVSEKLPEGSFEITEDAQEDINERTKERIKKLEAQARELKKRIKE